tara:strand:- start:262 stop:507 length:246 start_codon:yes stop_codon:yes gene_type:complete
MNLLGKGEETFDMSGFVDPFTKDAIQSIKFEIHNEDWRRGKTVFEGQVRTKINNTTGYHDVEADSLPELFKKVQSFIDSLR